MAKMATKTAVIVAKMRKKVKAAQRLGMWVLSALLIAKALENEDEEASYQAVSTCG